MLIIFPIVLSILFYAFRLSCAATRRYDHGDHKEELNPTLQTESALKLVNIAGGAQVSTSSVESEGKCSGDRCAGWVNLNSFLGAL